MSLAVIHRPRVAGAPPLGGTVWSTCHREVAFVAEAEAPTATQTVVGNEAYALILEIVCGLRSPLVGETEVQAQFKAFLSSLDRSSHGWLRQLGERVLSDAKAIRHEHLQGLGVGRYGDLALRRATGQRVALIGSGALAQDVLDHCEPTRPIDIWRRRDADELRVGFIRCRRLLIADADTLPAVDDRTSLIVAAPVAAESLHQVAACYAQLADIIDLRASDELTPLARPIRRTTLADIFADAEAGHLQPVALARAAIRERAKRYGAHGQLRPFGWDDLCA